MSHESTPAELDQLPTCMVGIAGPWPDADALFQALVDIGAGRYAAGEAPADVAEACGRAGEARGEMCYFAPPYFSTSA